MAGPGSEDDAPSSDQDRASTWIAKEPVIGPRGGIGRRSDDTGRVAVVRALFAVSLDVASARSLAGVAAAHRLTDVLVQLDAAIAAIRSPSAELLGAAQPCPLLGRLETRAVVSEAVDRRG